jgi:hypothetical protein
LRRLIAAPLLCHSLACLTLFGAVRSEFDESSRCWELSNGLVALKVCLTPDGRPEFRRLTNINTMERWDVPGAMPPQSQISVANMPEDFDGQALDLVSHAQESVGRGGLRQQIVLRDLYRPAYYALDLEIYEGHPVIRYRTRFVSGDQERLMVQNIDLLPWRLAGEGRSYTVFQLNQWVDAGRKGNFEPLESLLTPGGQPAVVFSGAHGQHMSWLAVRDEYQRGFFAGWEFDGRLEAIVSQSAAGLVEMRTIVQDMNHPVDTDTDFESPWAFIGVFHGDWDEAGYRTQRFAAEVLAPRAQHDSVPPLIWNSWGFDQHLDEATLRRNFALAASLGVEVAVIDLGWARSIGDWYEDPAKFPGGMRALSDYAHSLGLKFGVHFPFVQVSADAPIYRERPEWMASDPVDYFRTKSLCLSHKPAREWLIQQALRMIDDYGIDYFVQDGENMVKRCYRLDHTHDPGDSNYANAVEGLNAFIAELRRLRPHLFIENCEDGGNLMTFNMIRHYDTSIAADSTNSLASRQSVFGLSYVFPLTYASRYMTEEDFTTIDSRSYMFGGPMILMQQLTRMKPEKLDLLRGEIEIYKRLRESYPFSRVYHLTARPEETRVDAIQAHDERNGSGFVFVTRPQAAPPSYRLRPRGLERERNYRVAFQNSSRTLLFSGERLMTNGVVVGLPGPAGTEIVYYTPN